NGWVAFGPGSVPDAALSFEVRASTAALEHLYREDLWSPPPGAAREWREPLRMAWAPAAWDAFDRLFRSFGVFDPAPAAHQQSHWNTWGNFRNKQYDLRFIADRAANFGAAVLVIDDGWESYTSSGVHHPARFPRFFEDLKYARSKGLAIGLWEACGWVADPQAAGLSDRDLVLGKDGRPRRATWNMAVNSLGTAKFCLDLSSPRSREFLRRRTAQMMRAYAPVLLKLDFGYGLPGPDVGAPRDPALRGERLAFELLRTIRDAAREVDPKVAVQYYGIHPLMRAVTDVVALDDLGDAGGYEAEAHGQWSVWSALAAAQGVAVMASSGYDWAADAEILLNTAVIGSPGSVLPVPAPPDAVPARRAVARWHRRTTGWRPLWLNSEKGSIGHEPRVRCWGRLEGPDRLTAVALREEHPEGAAAAPLRGMKWRGRWALISQDEQDIFHTRLLACIPFGSGWLELPVAARPAQVTVAYGDREAPLAGWTFRDGRLRFRAPVGALGVLIRR
ncbi:MAG TPA: hypothetical protein VG672_21065, partial [Bryobacteraceae bacterium]|nr:hypothetical protein [Bryobacteraceae bacterium]